MPEIVGKKGVSRREAMFEEEGVEGVWIVRVRDALENRRVLWRERDERETGND